MRIIFYIFIFMIGAILFFSAITRHKKISIYKIINNKNVIKDQKIKNKRPKSASNNIGQYINIPSIFLDKNKITLLVASIFILIVFLILFLLKIEIRKENLATVVTVIVIPSLLLPNIFIKFILTNRVRIMLHTFPFFIDMVAACVQSGMTLENSLDYTAKHFYKINKDLASLMNIIIRRAEINGLVSAVKEINQQITTTEIKMFCNTINYSISFGSSIYEQLIQLSHEIREMQLLIIEEKIGKLSTKIIFPLFLFMLIPFITLVITPSVIGILSYGDIF